jgi:hypothetical protein
MVHWLGGNFQGKEEETDLKNICSIFFSAMKLRRIHPILDPELRRDKASSNFLCYQTAINSSDIPKYGAYRLKIGSSAPNGRVQVLFTTWCPPNLLPNWIRD